MAPMDLLVLDGVGTGHPSLAPWRATLVWVEAVDPTSGWRAGWTATARPCGPRGSSSCSTRPRLRRDDTRARADLRVDEPWDALVAA